MPYSDYNKHKQVVTNNNRKRRHRNRAKLVEHMGGKCVKCGNTENLEFDHIDKTTKTMKLSSMWHYSWDKILQEAQHCQLICKTCHESKTFGTDDYKHNKVSNLQSSPIV